MGLLLDFDLVSDKVFDERAEVAWLACGLGIGMQIVACLVPCLHEHVQSFCLCSINLFETFHCIIH